MFEITVTEPGTGRKAVLTHRQWRVVEDRVLAWVNYRVGKPSGRRKSTATMEQEILALCAEMGVPVDFDKQEAK